MTEAERERLLDRVRLQVARHLEQARFAESTALEVACHPLTGEPVGYDEAVKGSFSQFTTGQRWGSAWSTSWFRLRATVPEHWQGHRVDVRLHLGDVSNGPYGAEGILWRDGEPLAGVNLEHRAIKLADRAAGGEEIALYLEAACNPRPRPGLRLDPDYLGEPQLVFERAELALREPAIDAAILDFAVLAELAADLDLTDRRCAEILAALRQATAVLDGADARASAAAASEILAPPLSRRAGDGAHLVTAIGHAHIDTAWLWPMRETVRKCARTFSTTLQLLEDEPRFHFVCSQAQQHAWMQQHYPALFERMRALAADGRFHPTGSMWVEPDCNLPTGESLVRQIVYGKAFFRSAYGVDTIDCWLPDVFGCSAALPQILRQAGIRLFVSQKLSWNETTRHPHHSFWWEGIDGTRILAHFPPADTYNGEMKVAELRFVERNFSDHGVSNVSLYPFGHGDGGGGPTEEMLERGRRFADLEGLPKVRLEPVERFAERLEQHAGELATWVGELYLEYHRGTYTSQAAIKAGNRRGEVALYRAEVWSSLLAPSDGELHGELGAQWRTLLLHQFHDILPGSSINRVHRETIAAHEEVLAAAGTIEEQALERLDAEVGTEDTERPVLVTNPSALRRSEVVELPASLAGSVDAERGALVGPDGTARRLQRGEDGSLLAVVEVPSCGYARYDLRAGEVGRTAPEPVAADARRLENALVRVEIGEDGVLTSVYDKRSGRQVLAAGGAGNLLSLYADEPVYHDAWNLDDFYLDRSEELRSVDSIEVLESGPLRAVVRVRRSFGASSIDQMITLHAASPRLDFVTEVEWHERHRLLKAGFDVAVRAPQASYEIQFGHLQRATHANTDWDRARFEVVGHRFVDLSEPGYGVALLNDAKYGHRVLDGTLELSLLRAPTAPDPDADQGSHRFTYSLFPHPGSLQEGGVVEEATALNVPLRVTTLRPGTSGTLPPSRSMVAFDRAGVALSALKRAEEGEDLVLRLYECHGGRGKVGIDLELPVAAAWRTDLLEQPEIELPTHANPSGGTRVDLELRPFELVTLRLRLQQQHLQEPYSQEQQQ